MQIKIKQIIHENKVRQSSGKSFESCRILSTNSKGQDVWISGFGSQITHTWEVGDTIEIDLEQKGDYWNFKENGNTKPSPDKKLELLKEINSKLDILLGVNNIGKVVDNEIKVEDIPF